MGFQEIFLPVRLLYQLSLFSSIYAYSLWNWSKFHNVFPEILTLTPDSSLHIPHSLPLTNHKSPLTNHHFPLWFDWNTTQTVWVARQFSESQFHYGSIEISFLIPHSTLLTPYQSPITNHQSPFSIMVRLKLKEHEKISDRFKPSQFHYGSIEMYTEQIYRNASYEVSIPLWFDWNLLWKAYIFHLGLMRSQFHYGSIEMWKEALSKCDSPNQVSIPLWFDWNF